MVRSLIAVLALAAAGCTGGGGDGGGGNQPDGAQLIRDAAQATRELQSVRFDLTVDGTVSGISISSAQGQLTREGNVKGTAVITATGQPAETEFVIVGDTLYLKGPTGGFQQLPASVAATVYDPSKILDNNLGLPALIAGASSPSVQGKETVDGVETYHLQVTFAKNNLGVLLPGIGASADLPGELWIAASDPKRPVKAKVAVPGGGTVTIMLSDFNAPATITPPG
jgi:lipoprotein LprG